MEPDKTTRQLTVQERQVVFVQFKKAVFFLNFVFFFHAQLLVTIGGRFVFEGDFYDCKQVDFDRNG